MNYTNISIGSIIALGFGGQLWAADPVDSVDPFIGTGAHGHTYPGATVPFGMVQPSPDTGKVGWDWCSGYHTSDDSVMGFSQNHLTGTGRGELGDFLLMPRIGKVFLDPGSKEKPGEGYRSPFTHQQESASPGYYQVKLLDSGINVELTAAARTAVHRYTFPKSADAYVLLDLHFANHVSNPEDKTQYAWIKIVDDQTVIGWRITKGWSENRYSAFALRFSKPFKASMLYDTNKPGTHSDFSNTPGLRPELSSDHIKAVFHFDTEAGETVLAKIALSPVSPRNALANLEQEVPHWNFDEVRQQARKLWNDELSKITIKADKTVERVFYSALYHSMLAPVLHEDVNGETRGLDFEIHKTDTFTNYTIFSLWDTFRTAHPLATIIQPQRTTDFVRSMLAHYDQSSYKMLPVWELNHNETFCMIGYHGVPVAVDAWFKGLAGVDGHRLLNACVQTASNRDYQHLGEYLDRGYIAIDTTGEAPSKTLECAYDDWCIARLAKALGDEAIYQKFSKRSANYLNVWDEKTKFFRARKQDGTFLEPFDPRAVERKGTHRDYTEGNGWQWLWFVPHDTKRLFELLGGPEAAARRLDEMFALDSQLVGEVGDVTGLIGQYAHGNEPSHHTIYLYAAAGQPWKTQEKVRQICRDFYTDKPDGLIGNEDCGQMSAWYVMSALGFYPLNPVGGIYVLGAPMVERAEIRLADGRRFVVVANELSQENLYVQSVSLNGRPLKQVWITHDDVIKGGELVFTMGPQPNKTWAKDGPPVPMTDGK